jgi:hypothetical protein
MAEVVVVVVVVTMTANFKMAQQKYCKCYLQVTIKGEVLKTKIKKLKIRKEHE